MFEIEHYLTETGSNPFAEWYIGLKDRKVKQAIGDCKPCQDGVWELRIDVGPGWRVYYARSGKTVLLLLCGGDKRTQRADIARACAYWQCFQQEKDNDDENTVT